MDIFIPPIGTLLKLIQPWEFSLYIEDRNQTLFEAVGFMNKGDRWTFDPQLATATPERTSLTDITGAHVEDTDKVVYHWSNRVDRTKKVVLTLPVGAVLQMDRIYIRKGSDDFDSVTFFLKECEGRPKGKIRFWVKLDDVNKIKAEVV